jgi:putative glutamine amidotransferase
LTVAAPRIVVTLTALAGQARPDLVSRRTERYLEAVRRHGGEPVPVDSTTSNEVVAAAIGAMDGLLLTGGGDIDPSRYGQANEGSTEIDVARDELEEAAWHAAAARGLPVLGICRGLQAINVFSGGSLIQHIEGHQAASYGMGDPAVHSIDVVADTRLDELLRPGTERLVVNAYHHQGVRGPDLAPGLVAAAWADSSAGPLVEGLETSGSRFVVGVQCHPERQESTPAAFERVFAAFVDAARAGAARVGS